jgi:hypothetical protein
VRQNHERLTGQCFRPRAIALALRGIVDRFFKSGAARERHA